MDNRLAIRGIGLVGGFGCGKAAAMESLRSGGLPNSELTVTLADGEVVCPAYVADPTPLKTYVKTAKLRRVNKYSRLAALAACIALDDAGMETACANSRTAVIIASGFGASATTFSFLDSVIKDGDSFASPTMFSNSVHSAAGSNVSILLGITGPSLTITQFEMSTTAALLNAQSLLAEGVVDTVLFGAVDEINDVLTYCYGNFFGSEFSTAIKPLDFETQTAVPGEGAVCLVLTRPDETSNAYGYIDNVKWHGHDDIALPSGGPIIVGADGHRSTGVHYKKIMRQHSDRLMAYSDRFGSFPGSQAFDLAFGVLDGPHGGQFSSVKLDCAGNVGIINCCGIDFGSM